MAAFPGEVKVAGDTLDLGRGPMKVMSTYDPEELDWDGSMWCWNAPASSTTARQGAVHLDPGRAAGADLGPGQERRQDHRLRRQPPGA
jgi:hypothetical protein